MGCGGVGLAHGRVHNPRSDPLWTPRPTGNGTPHSIPTFVRVQGLFQSLPQLTARGVRGRIFGAIAQQHDPQHRVTTPRSGNISRHFSFGHQHCPSRKWVGKVHIHSQHTRCEQEFWEKLRRLPAHFDPAKTPPKRPFWRQNRIHVFGAKMTPFGVFFRIWVG